MSPTKAGSSRTFPEETTEVDLERVIKGDLPFFYEDEERENMTHMGGISSVRRNKEGKVTDLRFIHTTRSKGAREESIIPPGVDKRYPKGSYWYRTLHSIRTYQKETDPPRPNPTYFERIMNWLKK